MADNYYKLHQYVSNSNLTALQVALGERPAIGGDPTKAYNFGNLFDALMSEEELIDHQRKAVQIADGEWVSFDDATFQKAMNMKRDAFAHPRLELLMKNMEFQAVYKHERFIIDAPNAHFGLPVRGKLDGVNRPMKTGLDLKTTQAKTQKAFTESLFFFEYDRQCAWYMDIAGLDFFWFAGVCKEPDRIGKHPVFLHAVQRGGDFYKSGRAKYERLASLYHPLVLSLSFELMPAPNIAA